jgi:hypothetical protein
MDGDNPLFPAGPINQLLLASGTDCHAISMAVYASEGCETLE